MERKSLTTMESANRVAFYLSISVGIPIIIISYRCIFILFKPDYWKHHFCKIFVVSLITNSLVYIQLMLNLRVPGMGWFPGLYYSIQNAPWLQYWSYSIRINFQLAIMLSFSLSLNRVTALYCSVQLNEKIWRYFLKVYLPLMVLCSGGITIETALNRAEFLPTLNSVGETYFQFINFNLTRNVDTFFMTLETVLDAIANVLILLRFVRLRMDRAKRTVFENSLYFVSFANFISHCGTASMQLSLRYNWIPNESKPLAYLFSNAMYDATVLLPTVFILALTKEIRNAVKRTIMSITKRFCAPDSPSHQTVVTTQSTTNAP